MSEEAKPLGCSKCNTILINLQRERVFTVASAISAIAMGFGIIGLIAGIYLDIVIGAVVGQSAAIIMILGLLTMIFGAIIGQEIPQKTIMICPRCGNEEIEIK